MALVMSQNCWSREAGQFLADALYPLALLDASSGVRVCSVLDILLLSSLKDGLRVVEVVEVVVILVCGW